MGLAGEFIELPCFGRFHYRNERKKLFRKVWAHWGDWSTEVKGAAILARGNGSSKKGQEESHDWKDVVVCVPSQRNSPSPGSVLGWGVGSTKQRLLAHQGGQAQEPRLPGSAKDAKEGSKPVYRVLHPLSKISKLPWFLCDPTAFPTPVLTHIGFPLAARGGELGVKVNLI